MMRSTMKRRGGGSPSKQFQDTGMSSEARQMRGSNGAQPMALNFEQDQYDRE